MYNKYNITKEQLQEYLNQGLTNREIAEKIGTTKSNVWHFIKKFDLRDNQEKIKLPSYQINKIDSEFKAYFLGFVACDASIDEKKMVEISVEKIDREVLDYFSPIIFSRVYIDNTLDKKTRRFPRARMSKKIKDITAFIGGPLKKNRHLPIVKKDYNRYLLLGAFDADGCLTWGRRKDKNRLWQKISFTTSIGIATSIQNILIKELDISTTIRPKANEKDVYVIEFGKKENVLKFLEYIYQDDFIILKRKFLKYKALRLELEENGEGA